MISINNLKFIKDQFSLMIFKLGVDNVFNWRAGAFQVSNLPDPVYGFDRIIPLRS